MVFLFILVISFFQLDVSPANTANSLSSTYSQPHQLTQQERLSPGPATRQQPLSPSEPVPQPKFQSQHEITTDISPTKKPRLSDMYV